MYVHTYIHNKLKLCVPDSLHYHQHLSSHNSYQLIAKIKKKSKYCVIITHLGRNRLSYLVRILNEDGKEVDKEIISHLI